MEIKFQPGGTKETIKYDPFISIEIGNHFHYDIPS